MSATRDKSQKFTFVYSSFHQIYRRAQDGAKAGMLPGTKPGLTTAPAQASGSAAAPLAPLTEDSNPEAEPRPFSVRQALNKDLLLERAKGAPASGHVIKSAKVVDAVAEARGNAPEVRAHKIVTPEMPTVEVRDYQPIELMGKRFAKPAVISGVNDRIDMARKLPLSNVPVTNPAVESLKSNLRQLKDIHSRLRFMLQELEDLVKE